jgi:hypothetical protein
MLLIEILSKPVAASVAPPGLRKASRQRCLALPVWHKTFLKVITVWHNSLCTSNLRFYSLPHFIAPDSLLEPADRAC